MMRRFSAPAKVNLYLRIVGRRGDGYHLLESGMTFFPWFDHLEVGCVGEGITLFCQPEVTVSSEDNLVYRAARLLQRKAGIVQGAQLRLTKVIPHGAGLGGGSSDAATALLALNRLWGLDWPVWKLCELGLELGADIPFFLGGGSARVGGVGDVLAPYPECPQLELVVVYPDLALATASVYRGVTPQMIATGFQRGLEPVQGWVFQNDLEQVARGLTPVIGTVCMMLRDLGASVTLMSGSGSAVFGVFDHAAQALRAGQAIAGEQPSWKIQQGRTFNVHPFDLEWQPGI
ncbi:MAG: 4-(cytidine 5'-diphospho)-2-C-methyl-D-erythritol kinase [Nitrospirae bacterium]|nr:4-(cytidine 5'-diphospho)-2-C-methyl-D-erythritol kinase [Magnetococcales bacterium]